MQIMIIMQGASGSGKSTIANMIAQKFNMKIVSTDDFHYIDGKYCFSFDNLAYYHAWNQWLANFYLLKGESIIIDNTNILKEHAKPYFLMAKNLNVPVQIIKVNGNFNNVHKVPPEIVNNMKKNIQNLDDLLL